MLYIGTQSGEGCALYLDIHATGTDPCGVMISALIGDGQYEGEIHIALGRDLQVTYLDALRGDGDALEAFLSRHGREKIHRDLVVSLSPEVLTRGHSALSQRPRPHRYMPLFHGHGQVREQGI